MVKIRLNNTFLLLGLVLTINLSFGQTTNGVLIDYDGATRDPSAILEAYSTDQGVLLPRVALTGTDDIATVSDAPYPTSLMIYNTATANVGNANEVEPGYYYWNGSSWIKLMSGNTTPPTGAGADKKVTYWTSASDLSYSNKFHWDYTNELLGVGNASPISRLTVGEDIDHDASFNYSSAVATIFESENNNGGNTPNGTRDILHLVREGISSQAYGNKASFALGRYEDVSTKSRTQLDIKLTDESYSQHNAIMSLRSNGNVGIGTTSPNATIHAVNTGTGTQQDLAHLFAPNMSAGDALYLKLGKATGGTGNSADIVFNWQGADDPDNYLGFGFYNTALAMTITAAGNVGIGANHTPVQTLDVLGTGRFSDLDVNADRIVYADADGDLTISSSTIDPNALVDGNGSTPYLTKWADANTLTNSVVEEASGKIGIGMSPTKPLEVAGAIRSTGTFAIEIETTDGTGPRIKIGSTATPNSMIEFGAYNSQNNLDTKARDFQLFSTAATNGVMFKAATGNVGIGNTDPDAALTVGDGTNSSAYVHVKRNNNPHINLFEGTTSVARIQGDVTSGHNQFQIVKADGSNPMFVINQDDGKVGIATTDPDYTLDVRGTAQSEKLRLTNPDATATDASDNYVLQIEDHATPTGSTPTGWAINKSRYGGKYYAKNVSENARHKLTSAELFGGNANDNASVFNATCCSYGDYNSLYNGIIDGAGSSFHLFRSGCSGADWGITYAFDNEVQVDQIIMKRRPDCCGNRMDNFRIQLLDASSNVVQSIGPVSGSGDYNQSFTAVNCTQIRFYIPSCGNVGSGEGTINFSEFELYGISSTVTTVSQTNPTFVDPVILENIPSSLFGSTPQGLVVDTDGMIRSKAISEFGEGDNLGNHTATNNIQLNDNWLSNDGGSEGVRVDDNGNVGIGTTSPGAKLEVQGNASGIAGIQIANSADQAHTWIPYSNGSIYLTGDVGSGTGNTIIRSFSGGTYRTHLEVTASNGNITLGDANNSNPYILPRSGVFARLGSSGSPFQDVQTNYVYAHNRIRIGNSSSPDYPLHVSGNDNSHNFTARYYNYSGGTGTHTSWNISGYFSDHVACSELEIFSDARIKRVIGISDARKDLKSLMAIEITDYAYIDSITSAAVEKKVIAQQVKEIYPTAVSIGRGFIPNIYSMCGASFNSETKKLTITVDKKGHDMVENDRVRLILENGGTKEYAVLSVTDQHTFSVQLDEQFKGQEVFVYGKEVHDFHSVDYDAISMLNVSATQELVRIIEQLKNDNQVLQGQVNSSTENYNNLKAEVESLKQLISVYGMK